MMNFSKIYLNTMYKKDLNRYFIPVEVKEIQPNRWIKVKIFEYRLLADEDGTKFTHLKFVDINGFIIGKHMPTKLQSLYDKTALQVKNNAVKAASEIKNAIDDVATVAAGVIGEMKSDVSKTAKETASIAVDLFTRIKSLKSNSSKKDDENTQN